MNTYAGSRWCWFKGEGCRVWTIKAGKYWTLWPGWRCAIWATPTRTSPRPAAAQLTRLVHVSNIYYTTPMVELAEELVRLSSPTGSFSPTAAPKSHEGAIKLVRRYSRERFGAGRHRIICTENSFHGRTLGALSATGQSKFWQGFDPLLPGFAFVPFNDLDAVAKAVDDTSAP